MNFKIGTGFTLDSEVSGECENGDAIVCGKLSIVSAETYSMGGLRIDRVYYISNSAGRTRSQYRVDKLKCRRRIKANLAVSTKTVT